MPEEIVVRNPRNVQLLITHKGEAGTLPDPIDIDSADGDIKQIATEAVRTGYVPGIAADPAANFQDYVVERYAAKDGLPERAILRPKTEFGGLAQ